MNDNVAYSALPREFKGRRNMIIVGPKKDQGRFRSGRPKDEVYVVPKSTPSAIELLTGRT
jgi:hypothetical protein